MPIDRLRPSFKSVPGREHSWGLRLQLLAILTLSLSPLLVLSVAQGVMEFRDESSRQRDSFHSILIEASAEATSTDPDGHSIEHINIEILQCLFGTATGT